MNKFHDITIALGALSQAVFLTQRFALEGKIKKTEEFQILTESIMMFEASNTLEIYGDNLANLKTGFKVFIGLSSKSDKLNSLMLRYFKQVLDLAQILQNDQKALDTLAQRLQSIKGQLAFYEDNIMHEQVILKFASSYSDIVSPLGSKIKVLGKPEYLSRTEIQNKIRTLLLAAVRASILFKQVGGSKLQLLFFNNRIINQARSFLDQIAKDQVI